MFASIQFRAIKPTLDEIADQTINEDADWATINLNNILPAPGATTDLTVTAKSDNPGLIPDPTVTYTSPNSIGKLNFKPVANQFGTATITVTVINIGDGGTANDGFLIFERTFKITVNPVNDAPTLDPLIDRRSVENTGKSYDLTGISAGPGETQNLTITAETDNPDLIPNLMVDYSYDPDKPLSPGKLIFYPTQNATGTAKITVTVKDNGGTANGGVDTFEQSFTVTIYPFNDPPTLDAIPDQKILEDAAATSVDLTGITAGPNETQNLTISVKSDNPGLIPDPTIDYTSPNTTGKLTFKPVANQFGNATITVTIKDDGGTGVGGIDTFEQTFTITVDEVNDPPTLDAIADVTINEDAGYDTLKLTGISTGIGERQNSSLNITSDKPELMDDFGFVGDRVDKGDFATLQFKPEPNAFGETTMTVTLKDYGGTANGGVDTIVRTFKITVNPVNDPPTLDAIPDQTIDEDSLSGKREFATVAFSGISAGPGEKQNLKITAKSDNPGLIPDPIVTYSSPDVTGMLEYKLIQDQFGTATITVTVTDDGGTENGGVNVFERTFTITVNPVNDGPSFSGLKDLSVPKNAGAQTEAGFATNLISGPANESDQTLSFDVVADKPELFAVQPKIDSTGTLTYTPAKNAKGIATVSVTLRDNGGTDNGGEDQSDPESFVIDVAPNRAPVLAGGKNRRIGNIAVGSPTPLVSWIKQFGAIGVTDLDEDNVLGGIAVTGVDSKDGRWMYSVANASDWKELSVASAKSAVLLSPDAMVQFWPNQTFSGTAKFTYHAWDQSSGKSGDFVDLDSAGSTGGGTPYSVGSATAFVRAAPVIFTQNEDEKTNGRKLDSWKGVSITDADGANAKSGLAIVGSGGNVNGRWEYNLGKGWQKLVGMSPDDATLLRRSDSLRFVPDAHQFGDAYLEFSAWDQSTGFAGTRVDTTIATGAASAFSEDTDGFYFRVTSVNDRPVLDAGKGFNLTPVKPGDTNPPGDLVSAIIGSTMTDADIGTKPGMAVTSRGKIGGTWQYQLAAGGGWKDFPTVTDAKALLLGPDDKVRLIPSGTATSATFSFKAWDQTSGKAGDQADSKTGTAFSIATGKATVSITSVPVVANTAPSLSSLDTTFTSILEDSKPKGDTVGFLLGTSFVDADAGALKGIAVIGKTRDSRGVWQYSLNGVTWMSVGDVSESRALLLRDTDKLRFVPNPDFYGEAKLSYRAWDRTGGTPGQFANLSLANTTGGSSAFGLKDATATLKVKGVNDRPVLDGNKHSGLHLVTPGDTNPPGELVADILGDSLSDAGVVSPIGLGFTFASPAKGTWEYQLNGNTGWTTVPKLNWGDMLLLRGEDRLRFVPAKGFTGQVPLWYRGWDASSGKAGEILSIFAPGNSWSQLLEQRSITVGSANVRPVLNVVGNLQLPSVAVGETAPKGSLVSTILGKSVFDANVGDAIGIAVTGVDSQNGSWQYSLDGTAWSAIGSVSSSSALVLKGTSQLRFVPKAGFAGNATISFKAWDQSDKALAGTTINAGKSTAVSQPTQTASLAVNTAPTLTIV